jgi:CRISPR/Cas system-associated endonuclease Cas3-HD
MYGAFKDKNYKFIIPALLHDIGKPFVAYQKPSDKVLGIYSFTNHEEKSYQIIKNWFFLSNWTKDIVRYHFILRDMQRTKEKNEIIKFKILEEKWLKLSEKFILDLHTFQKYDDFGKK